MFVRRTRVEFSPEKLERTIQTYQQELLPAIKQEAGFRGAVLLANRATGAAQSVTLWESEEAERASRPTGDRLRTQAAPDKLEDGIRFVREQVVPLLKQQAGFLAVIWVSTVRTVARTRPVPGKARRRGKRVTRLCATSGVRPAS
jgi:heme-degrading monooxygenase HmoA